MTIVQIYLLHCQSPVNKPLHHRDSSPYMHKGVAYMYMHVSESISVWMSMKIGSVYVCLYIDMCI